MDLIFPSFHPVKGRDYRIALIYNLGSPFNLYRTYSDVGTMRHCAVILVYTFLRPPYPSLIDGDIKLWHFNDDVEKALKKGSNC